MNQTAQRPIFFERTSRNVMNQTPQSNLITDDMNGDGLHNLTKSMRSYWIKTVFILVLSIPLFASFSSFGQGSISLNFAHDNCISNPQAGTYNVSGSVNGKPQYLKNSNSRIVWSGSRWELKTKNWQGIENVTHFNTTNTTKLPCGAWQASYGCFLPNVGGDCVSPPTGSTIPDVSVYEGAVNTVINLETYFDDDQDGAAGLIYTKQSTDASFYTASINGSNQLIIDFGESGIGTGSITVRATDSEGDYIEGFFAVSVSAPPPTGSIIIDFEDDGFVDWTNYGSKVYVKDNFKITYPTMDWFESSDGEGGTYALMADGWEFDYTTIILETVDGSEIDFISFYYSATYQNLLNIEGFKDGVSTGIQSASLSGNISLNDPLFDEVDKIHITSGDYGFIEDKFDNFIFLPLASGPDIPEVSTTVISTYDASSATIGGNVTNDGGASITERGVVYNTTGTPNTSDTKAQIGTGTGSFSQSVTGLSSGTTYYVRAYAINSEGTSYGSEESFTTSTPTLVPTQSLYWPNNEGKKLEGISIAGTDRQDILSGSVLDLVAIDIDLTNEKAYWYDQSTGKIHRANLDGSGIEVFVTDPGYATTIFIDQKNGYLYWPNNGASKIERINLDGTGRKDIISATDPIGITVDVTGSKVYWFDQTNYKIYRGNVDGSGTEVFISNPGYATTIYFDQANGYLYWPNNEASKIERIKSDGTERADVISATDPIGITVDVINSKVYWFDQTNYKIYRGNINGTSTEVFVSNPGYATTLVVPYELPGTPTVATTVISTFDATSASMGGEVTSAGLGTVTDRGVVYNSTGTPTISDVKVQIGTGTGIFSQSISSLSASTTYYVRAYAINSEGTSYGAEESFTTSTPTPDINIKGNGVSITNGDGTATTTDHTDFGSVSTGSGTVSRIFTIENTGSADLNLADYNGRGNISVGGTHASDFTISNTPGSSSIASGNTIAFSIEFNPSVIGERSATVYIGSNDTDETPYSFAIKGTGTNSAPTITLQDNKLSTNNTTAVTFNTAGSNAITIADTDGDDQSVTISTTGSGNFTLSSTTGLSVTGDGTSELTLSGSVSTINSALEGAVFDPASTVGQHTIAISSNDGTVSVGPAEILIGVFPASATVTTEGFEAFTNADASFTNATTNQTFSFTSSTFTVTEYAGFGIGASDFLIDNFGNCSSASTLQASFLISNDQEFYSKSFWLFPSEDCNMNGTNGTIIIRGKNNSTTQFTKTILSTDLNNDQNTNEGFTFIEMDEYAGFAIDELEFETSGSISYVGVDDFNFVAEVYNPDVTPPAVTITSTKSSPTNASSIPLSITFSEEVNDFVLGDIDVTGGTLNNFNTSDNIIYSADLLPTAGGTITVDIDASKAKDNAGNNNEAAPRFSISYDGSAPAVTITSIESGYTEATPIPLTITFSEEVNDFIITDITVSGGTLNDFSTSDNMIYTVNLTPTTEGVITVDIDGSKVGDHAGNGNKAAMQYAVTYQTPLTLIYNTTLTSDTGIELPLGTSGSVNVTVDWGDGSSDTYNSTGIKNHTYAVDSTYTVKVFGSLDHFGYGANHVPSINNDQLVEIAHFGNLGITNLSGGARAASNLITVPDNIPSNVTDLTNMFRDAVSFNQGLNGWDVSTVESTAAMFWGAIDFNGNISDWEVSKVTNMNSMFAQASKFNQDISGWNTENSTSMSQMFFGASSFNQNIGGWNVSKVESMMNMFFGVSNFNYDLSNWNTQNVTNMRAMFLAAGSFNQNLNNWNVSQVTDMSRMFEATAINQKFDGWDVSGVMNMTDMFKNETLSSANYDATLTAWSALTLQSGVTLNAGKSQYSPGTAETARQKIIDDFGWIIIDGGLNVPNVTLSQLETAFAEKEGSNTINITLSKAYASNVTVTLGIKPSSTATLDTDVTLSSTIVEIVAGETTGSVSLTAIDDANNELAESVIVEILSVTNGIEDGIQEVTSMINDDEITIANAGTDQNVCGTSTTLLGNNADAGLGESGTWSILSGVGGSISDPTSINSDFSGSVGVTYTLRWTIGDGMATNSQDEVKITFYGLTSANAGPDQDIQGAIFNTTMQGNASTGLNETGTWSIVAGNGNGILNDPNSPTTAFSGEADVTYTLRWTISNGVCSTSSDDVAISFTNTAGILVAEDGSSTAVSETGSTDHFTVVLTTEPSSNVQIVISGSDDGEVSHNTSILSFTPSNWNAPQTITVSGVDDDLVDGSKYSTITIGVDAANSDDAFDDVVDQTINVTNEDDDVASVTIADISGNEDNGSITITATLDHGVDGGFTVEVNTTEGTATTMDEDYTAVSAHLLTFTGIAGETQTFTVTPDNDTKLEADETLTISLSNLAATTLPVDITDEATVTITNDDAAAVIIADISGNEDDGAITVTATLDHAVQGGFTVEVSTTDGTATTGNDDYTSVSGYTLTFAGNAGEFQTFTLTPTVDSDAEFDETVVISQSNHTGTTLGVDISDGATVTITNDDVPLLTVGDDQISEGDAGTAIMSFEVNLDRASPGTITVDYATEDGTATAGSDYSTKSGTLTFAPGETTKTVEVAVTGEDVLESDEYFRLNLSTATGTVSILDDSGLGTISNDDVASVTIADISGNEDDGSITITATLDHGVEGGFTVEVNTTEGTATTMDEDYTAVSAHLLTFTGIAGETQTFTVTPENDTKLEADETLTISLSNLAATTLPVDITDEATVTITNDDAAAVTIADISGNEDDGAITVTATLDHAVQGGFTVEVSSTDGTATRGNDDYTSVSGYTLTFAGNAGESQTFTLIPTVDSDAEFDETVVISQSNHTGTTLGVDISDGATVTITNDDVPLLTVGDDQISEGDAGTAIMSFEVNLDRASPGTITVDYATEDGTATAGSDYSTKSGTLTFAPGETTKTVEVAVTGEDVLESDEYFRLNLSTATGTVSILDDSGLGTISNDDVASVTIADISGNEDDGSITITATLDHGVEGGFTVEVNTTEGTATTMDEDYTAVSAHLLTFTGIAGETQTFTVTPENDTKLEADETLTISLSNLAATTLPVDITDEATVTITNDDAAAVIIADISGNEDDGAITVTATLDHAVQGGFTVEVSTTDGTATTGNDDYTAVSGYTLTFAGNAGESQTFTLIPTVDSDAEFDETVVISQSNHTGTTLGVDISDGATVTITNDDVPLLTVGDDQISEGDAGTAIMSFEVNLDRASPGTITVDYATEDGTATAGSDYSTKSGTLTFAPGETTKTVEVAVTGEDVLESDEYFRLNLSTATGTVSILDDSGLGTISNDDVASVTIADISGNEDDGSITITSTLDHGVEGGFTVEVNTTEGTATTMDEDYTAVSAHLLTFTGIAGETQTFTVTPENDTKLEADETLTISLSNLAATTLPVDITDEATVTITNDDAAAVTIADISGNEDDGAITVTATLDHAVQGGFTVEVNTADGTATTGNDDYTSVSGYTLTFAGNEGESQSFLVSPVTDGLVESDETVTIGLSHLAATAFLINLSDEAILTITNDDQAPVVTAGQLFSIDENSGYGTTIGMVAGSDPDDDVLQSWMIVHNIDLNNNGIHAFIINTATGELTVSDPDDLDFESDESLDLELKVSDGSNSSAVEFVEIRVNDLNDNAPQIIEGQSFSLDEFTADGTVIGQIFATDKDANTIYGEWNIIEGNIGNAFIIDESTGELILSSNSTLDFDNHPIYNLTLTVGDGAHTSDKAVVSVKIGDSTSPSVTLTTMTPEVTNSASVVVTATFNESVTGFELNDLNLSNAIASDLSTTDNRLFTFYVQALAEGNVRVSIGANSAEDAAGNGTMGSNDIGFYYDITQPVVTLSKNVADLTNTVNAIVLLDFSEPVIDFEAADLVINKGTIESFQGTQAAYQLNFSGTEGLIEVTIPEGVAFDRAGNGNEEQTISWELDITPPQEHSVAIVPMAINSLNEGSVSFEILNGISGATFTYEFTSSETSAIVSGAGIMDNTDFTVSGVDLSAFPSGVIELNLTLTDLAGNTAEPVWDQVIKEAEKEIPEGFSPNGDGVNDQWVIPGIEDHPNNTVIIYNRYGKVVWETAGYDNRRNAWDSRSNVANVIGKNGLPDGTYFYIIKFKNSKMSSKSGFVIINR